MLLQATKQILAIASLATVAIASSTLSSTKVFNSTQGNAIFIHPDGTSAAHWGAARIFYKGPDARLNWDKMSRLGVYTGGVAK